MGLFYTETPSGERRRWTLKEFVQGRPIGHPSHVMFVHFPVALYIGALGLDLVSRIGHFPTAPLAATWLIFGAFAGSLFAVPTGLVDWWGMKPGSRTRKIANKHLLLQLTTAGIFVVDAVVRWGGRTDPRAHAPHGVACRRGSWTGRAAPLRPTRTPSLPRRPSIRRTVRAARSARPGSAVGSAAGTGRS